MPQLDVSTYSSQIFWLIVSFAMLFAVVRGLASPRLSRVLGERAARTGGDIAAAEAARADAAAREKALAERLAAAHEASRAELARAVATGAAKTSASLADLGKRLGMKLHEAEGALAGARASAERELEGAARELTAELVHRFTDATPPPERLDRALGAVGGGVRS